MKRESKESLGGSDQSQKLPEDTDNLQEQASSTTVG